MNFPPRICACRLRIRTFRQEREGDQTPLEKGPSSTLRPVQRRLLPHQYNPLFTPLVWIINFGTARYRICHPRGQKNYGNAYWIVLGALVALLLGFGTSALGGCGRY